MPSLICDHTSCDLTTVEEGSLSEKLQHLQLYVQTAHSQGQHHPQAERVRRPVLGFTGQTLEQEDFVHFLYLCTWPEPCSGGMWIHLQSHLQQLWWGDEEPVWGINKSGNICYLCEAVQKSKKTQRGSIRPKGVQWDPKNSMRHKETKGDPKQL